jgi:hypothetical protein
MRLQIRITMLESKTIICWLFKLKVFMSVLILSSTDSCVYKIQNLNNFIDTESYIWAWLGRDQRSWPGEAAVDIRLGVVVVINFPLIHNYGSYIAASWWLCYRPIHLADHFEYTGLYLKYIIDIYLYYVHNGMNHVTGWQIYWPNLHILQRLLPWIISGSSSAVLSQCLSCLTS